MMRSRYCTLLLFSFCLLFAGCRKNGPSLDQLALQGDFEKLERAASDDFSATYQKSSLYYVALAQERLGKLKEAASSLHLYLAMTGKQGASAAAAQLAVLLGNRVGDAELVIDMGLLLEEKQALDERTAKELYQALLSRTRTDDAHRIFTTYLKETIDSFAYATVLVEAKASFSLVKQAFSSLSDEHAVTLLQYASSMENGVQHAYDYFVFALSYENRILDGTMKKNLYTALARFASQADQRVQANKYQSLANTLP